jgi:hypothetical protein
MFENADLIHRYSRADALREGVLIDVSATAREARILWPVAIRRGGSGPEVRFTLHVRNDNRDRTPPLVRLKALCGPVDDGVPCIMVRTRDEDCANRGTGEGHPSPL